ncbi:MAG: Fur family transcriptional regulator [Chloroflexi bacterium]|nr:Fur family transcriptional regulator [Chloroflexota bacterium]
MSCESETLETLRQMGQRPTPQRLMVIGALRHAGGHATAGELLDRVRPDYPSMDISTVYRTLSVFRDLGLVTETNMGGGDTYYEWSEGETHHHLVCRSCGGATEFEDRHMETLRAEIKDRYGFDAEMDHFAIFGTCSRCALFKKQ